MPHAIQIRQTGDPEVLNWTAVEAKAEIAHAHGCKHTILYTKQDFIADAADAHKALEARATSGSTILTI